MPALGRPNATRASTPYGRVPGAIGPSDAMDIDTVKVNQGASPFAELGLTGLKRAAGYVDEEFLPELKGRKAVQVFREMGDNDPIVGTLLFTLTYLLREVEWTVKEAGPGREDTKAAKFLETCRDDMSHSWGDFVAEALTCLQYGWSWHEIVYKRCQGMWQADPRRRSMFNDGMVRWRKLPIRSQESMQRWVFDAQNETVGMVQMAPPDYATRVLPMERSLLFRTGVYKGNPEGYSLLRRAYRPWFFKKRFEEFESVGVERDLAGIPIARVPSSYLNARSGTQQFKMVQAIQKMVRGVRRNEQEGILYPMEYDEDTRQPLFDFSLLQSGGARQFSTNEIIARLSQHMLMTCLADFILVGHEETGTYNMHADKRGIFNTACNVVNQSLADTINRHAVPKLFKENRWMPQRLPKFVPADVDAPDLGQLAEFLSQTAAIGFNWGPDANIERYLRDAADLPEMSTPEFDQLNRLATMTRETRMYETQSAWIAARQQIAAGVSDSRQAASGEPNLEQAQTTAGAQAEQAAATQQAAQGKVDDKRAQEAHDASISEQKARTSLARKQAVSPQSVRPSAKAKK